jgi:RNA polymerase-binding transcription factor DksA
MASNPQARTSIAYAPEVEGRRDREAELRQARRFRRAQVASLERELSDDPRRDTVRRALLIAATTALAEIDAALDRVARGAYGRCVTCARPIPEDRLDALPVAGQCMPCHFNDQNCRWSP